MRRMSPKTAPRRARGVFSPRVCVTRRPIAAAETAVAIAIIINIYRNLRNIEVKNLDELMD